MKSVRHDLILDIIDKRTLKPRMNWPRNFAPAA